MGDREERKINVMYVVGVFLRSSGFSTVNTIYIYIYMYRGGGCTELRSVDICHMIVTSLPVRSIQVINIHEKKSYTIFAVTLCFKVILFQKH